MVDVFVFFYFLLFFFVFWMFLITRGERINGFIFSVVSVYFGFPQELLNIAETLSIIKKVLKMLIHGGNISLVRP